MNYGLYTAASGALTHLKRMDVYANNLANSTTVGFKPDVIDMRHRLPERLENNVIITPHRMLERLGGGVAPESNRISTAQGSLRLTKQSLDLAIEGEGFLVVRTGPGAQDLRLTRDGRLSMDDNGMLVMANSGRPVLDSVNRPIHLDRFLPVEIRPDGNIAQGDQVVARLQLAAPLNQRTLVKDGGNLLRVRDGAINDRRPAEGRVLQGYVEDSAVNAIKTLMALTGAAKAAQGNAKMMQYHDHIMGQAINTLGRVA